MSDGGGDVSIWTAVPITAVVAACAILVTVALAIIGHVRQLRAERNGAVDAALASLLTPSVIEARVRVVQVGRGEYIYRNTSPIEHDPVAQKLANDEMLDVVDKMRASSLTLMWAVQGIEPRLRPVTRRHLGVSRRAPWLTCSEELRAPSAPALHAQIAAIMEDLVRALSISGYGFDWRREALLTNAVLDDLPAIRSGRFVFTSEDIHRLDPRKSGDDESILKDAFGQAPVKSVSFERWKRDRADAKAQKDREWTDQRARWKPTVKPPRPPRGQR